MNRPFSAPSPHRAFKLIFVPLLLFSLFAQLAVVWTQLDDIRDGYFDFVLYYSAARIVQDGNGKQLYDLGVQREYQKAFGRGHGDRDLPFNHPPYELLALLLPARFSFPVAHVLWALFHVLLLAILLVRILPFVAARYRALCVLMLIAYFPTIMALKMGQDSIITTFLLAETFVNLKKQRYALAGGTLALGLYKPQFVLPLIGILLLHRRWSSLLGFLLVALLLAAVSLAMVTWDGLIGLFALWLPMIDRGHVVWPELMTNLRGLAYVVLHPGGLAGATNGLTLALSMVIYAMTLRLWPRSADTRSELFDLRYALAVIMTALVSFHSYSYDATLLILPLVVMLNQVLKESGPYPVGHRVFLAAVTALFIPLLPNVLLSEAILAWWALPLPVLFAVTALEICRQRGPAVAVPAVR